MPKLQNIYKVVSNEKLCPRFSACALMLRPLSARSSRGSLSIFVQAIAWNRFSAGLLACTAPKKYVEIFYEIVGPGTKILSLKKKGDPIDALGPLGVPFRMPPKGNQAGRDDRRRDRRGAVSDFFRMFYAGNVDPCLAPAGRSLHWN